MDGVPDLPPVDQVAALKHRHAGKVLEGAGDQVVVLADADHAGVGVKTGQHGVAVGDLGARLEGGLEGVRGQRLYSGVARRERRGGQQAGHRKQQGKSVHGASLSRHLDARVQAPETAV